VCFGVNCYGGGVFLSRYVGGIFSRPVSTQNTRQEMSAELWRIRVTIAVKGRGNLGNYDKKGTQGKHGKIESPGPRHAGV